MSPTPIQEDQTEHEELRECGCGHDIDDHVDELTASGCLVEGCDCICFEGVA